MIADIKKLKRVIKEWMATNGIDGSTTGVRQTSKTSDLIDAMKAYRDGTNYFAVCIMHLDSDIRNKDAQLVKKYLGTINDIEVVDCSTNPLICIVKPIIC
jgi:hypothetical protein